ncbi:MAG: hypothetical protein ABSG77_16405 [Candidatus Acidiferrum sp.]|jgi:hypothetical protein
MGDDKIAEIISDEFTAELVAKYIRRTKDDKFAARNKRPRGWEERRQKSLESLNPEDRAKLLKTLEELRRQSAEMRAWLGLGLGPYEIN